MVANMNTGKSGEGTFTLGVYAQDKAMKLESMWQLINNYSEILDIKAVDHGLYLSTQFLRVVKQFLGIVTHLLVSWSIAHVEIEKGAKMVQELVLAPEH